MGEVMCGLAVILIIICFFIEEIGDVIIKIIKTTKEKQNVYRTSKNR